MVAFYTQGQMPALPRPQKLRAVLPFYGKFSAEFLFLFSSFAGFFPCCPAPGRFLPALPLFLRAFKRRGQTARRGHGPRFATGAGLYRHLHLFCLGRKDQHIHANANKRADEGAQNTA